MELNITLPEKIFIIAEIGINHNGSLKIAKELIDMAKRCGCDAVKFQKRDIDTVYSKNELEKFGYNLVNEKGYWELYLND